MGEERMRILYYSWDEMSAVDAMECLRFDGNEVECFSYPVIDKLNDVSFAKKLEEVLKEKKYDCIFTFDFFPIISKVAYAYEIKYISWIFDSPHLTLYSKAVFNENNYIFHFDKMEVEKLSACGVKKVYHMPLAVNVGRLQRIFEKKVQEGYSYQVSFLGNLYNNEFNFFDQIKNMPEYYQGFFQGLIQTQMQLYGYDVASEVITDELFEKMKAFVTFQLDEEMYISEKDVFISVFQKKVTVEERKKILQEVSERYPIAHFAMQCDTSLKKVDYQGYAPYATKMPFVFRDSKINLNITLRSILSGIPLRCLDIMGAGGFLLSNYQPELSEYFRNGEEMVMYESHSDLMGKIEYYLSHEKERKEIAKQGEIKIQQEFTYEKLLRKIFAIVFEK